MCGRYAAGANPDELVEAYDLDLVTEEARPLTEPRYNIAPTQEVPAVVERARDEEHRRMLVALRWGLVPSWAKDATGGARMINARSETVAHKPAYRAAFRERRCIVPALGYYEWRGEPRNKQPWFLQPEDGMLSMAGIYEFWKSAEGWLSTVSIITTSATDDVGWIHDRMPMTTSNIDAWLDPDLKDPEAALCLLSEPVGIQAHPVSRRVNHVANDGPDLIQPVEVE